MLAGMNVIDDARTLGFELEERPLNGEWVWGWRRRNDDRWPCFLERGLAVSWMADRLGRGAAVER
jgi:hypothetical protein